MNVVVTRKRIRTAGVLSLLLWMALGLLGSGGGVAAQTEQNPLPANGSWTICHFTNENAQNLYITNTPNLNSFDGANGHFQHDGGADIIPPFWYLVGDTPTFFAGLNWDAAGQAQFANNCQPPAQPLPPAILANAQFINASCVVAPAVIMPPNGNGVTYTLSEPAAPGVTVVITATLNTDTHQWGNTAGWLPNPPGDNIHLTQSFTFANPDCREPAVLGVVTFVDATCDVKPEIILPPDGNGVTYSQDSIAGAGATVIVSATLNSETHVWGDTTGWAPNPPGEATVLTQSFTFSELDCREPAVLGVVAFADATCDDAPSLTLPAGGNGVTYSQDGPAVPGATVVVSATLNTETHVWGTTNGWLPNPVGDATVLTQSFTFADPDCEVPELPAATLGVIAFSDATCKDDPELTLPEDGNGVAYTQDKDAEPGMTVVVSATLNSETHQWGSTTGWTSTDDPNVVARSFTFADPDCEIPEIPEKPEKSAPPKTSDPAEVSKLPVTGSGSETSNPGGILTITALGAVSLAGAVILGERKRI